MKLKNRTYARRHLFMPGHTIGSVIKQQNLYDVSKEEMVELVAEFVKLNGSVVLKAGSSCLVPVLEKHLPTVFSLQETP